MFDKKFIHVYLFINKLSLNLNLDLFDKWVKLKLKKLFMNKGFNEKQVKFRFMDLVITNKLDMNLVISLLWTWKINSYLTNHLINWKLGPLIQNKRTWWCICVRSRVQKLNTNFGFEFKLDLTNELSQAKPNQV